MSVLMIAVAGFFLGGVYSFWRNGHRVAAVVMFLLAGLAVAAAVLWAK